MYKTIIFVAFGLLFPKFTIASSIDRYDFYVPETKLDSAINQLAIQAGYSAIFPSVEVSQFRSSSVTGRYSLRKALDIALSQTGFIARVNADKVITIHIDQQKNNNEDKAMIKSNRKGLYTAILGAIFGSSASSGVLAQNEPAGFALEEVIVTARKVEENQQDVPIAITAFSGDTLERRQISSSDDIGKITPNLQFTGNAPLAGNNNSSVIFIRGVGQISPRANTDPGVGLYIDDVYMGQSVGGVMELKDISNVQVLRGPQGTLFGRNTIGGAVVLSTTDPGEELGGKIRVGTGDDSLLELFGAIDIPITDTLLSRFSAGTKQQDGYVTRVSDGADLGDTDNTTLTAKFLFTPSDTFTAKLNFDYTEADENGSPLVFADINPNTDVTNTGGHPGWIAANASVGAGCPDAWVTIPGPFAIEGTLIDDPAGLLGTVLPPPRGYVGDIDDARCANNSQDAGPYANNGTAELGSTLENRGTSLNLEWDLSDELTFKSVTSYRELEWTGRRDADNTPLTILHTDYSSDGDQLSQEFQLTYQSDKVSAVAGVYYYEEEISDVLTVTVGDRGATGTCGVNASGETLTRCHLDSDNNITDNQSNAVFGQITYNFTDKLSGTFGIRRTEETKASTPEQFDWVNSVNGDPATVNATPSADQLAGTAAGYGDFYLEPKRYEEDFSATTISANVSYDIHDSTMVYASYSEGFKGGGWNSSFNFSVTQAELDAGQQFDQEEVKSYEIGFKSDLTDSLRVNGALFKSDYTDLQFVYRVFIAPWLFNAGEASIDGAELEFTWLPNSSWIIEGGLGYLDTSIDEAAVIEVPGQTVSSGASAGNQLPFAPELQGNLGVGYIADVGNFQISPRMDITFSDSVFFDAANTEAIAQSDNFTTLDLSLTFEQVSSDWKIAIALRNATDEEYRVSGNSSLTSGTGYGETVYARPKMWTAHFTKNF